MPFEIFEASAAVLAALFGGLGVKLLEKLMSKKSEAFTEATQLREELRTEKAILRAEADEWKDEADKWREKYYDAVEENLQLNQQFESLRLEYFRLKMTLGLPTSGSF